MLRIAISCVVLFIIQNGCIARPNYAPCFDAVTELEARLNAQPGLVGWERPRCDTDGSYLGMQYGGSKAFCVTKGGVQIERYEVNRWQTGENMDCQCARDKYEHGLTGRVGKMFRCEQNGNYSPYGCLGSVCYCQDKYGNQAGPTTVHIADTDFLRIFCRQP